MQTVGRKLMCDCHNQQRIIVKNHPRLGKLCRAGADKLRIKKDTDYKAVCWRWFSLYIRLRYADSQGLVQCFTCPTIQNYKKMDCGHGITRQHAPTFLDERNNHPQCANCNWLEEGRKDRYKENVDKKYGAGTWDKLEILSKTTLHRNNFEWKVLAHHYKQRAQELHLALFGKPC